MTDIQQKTAAKAFAKYWEGKGYEKGESQPFWISLLRDVFDVAEPEKYIKFEDQVKLDTSTGFIDGFISETHVMIEQKGAGKDLNKAIKQSDGSLLTPFQQAKRYSAELPYSERPRWIITCNFQEFYVYDMENPRGEPEKIKLADLEKEYYRLSFLVDKGSVHLQREMEISIKAGEVVGLLYDGLLKQYKNPEDPETLKHLNKLCVRLVFCLYAEDAGIFGKHLMFHDYLKQFSANQLRKALTQLFKVLNQKPEERDPYLADDDPMLAAFPYVNGGLFADETVIIPPFNDELKTLLLQRASADFDWSEISPTIFGAVFESTLNPETRRSGGMHYTSIENIHKVIDPLFLNDLKAEFESIKAIDVWKTKEKSLLAFQRKLASLEFLDPAAGSGNFLTESYLSLRRLENAVISELHRGQISMDAVTEPILVSISQFHGIEINDFAVTVAKTALWIAESQMMKETSKILVMDLDFLPLKTNANIVEGNALRIDWESVVDKTRLNYIMGNPPFVGARWMGKEQKTDVLSIFGKDWKGVGDLDYVSCWYKKAADYIKDTSICCALVSTNSITQGGAVSILWKPLFDAGVHIDFAYRTFRWDSEASLIAHVHCVIIGFSVGTVPSEMFIYENGQKKKVKLKYNICRKNKITLFRVKERTGKEWRDVADAVYTIHKRKGKKELQAVIQAILDSIDPASNMWTRRNPLCVHSSITVDLERDANEIREYLTPIPNSLVDLRPDLVKEWNVEKNGHLRPEMFGINSNDKVWWKCSKCGHEWRTTVIHRGGKRNSGCPECAKEKKGKTFTKRRVVERGSLAEKNPALAAEWHPTKNGSLTPADVTEKRFANVWWLCPKCGYEWKASPNNRSKGVGCPCCSGRVPKIGVNDFKTLYPDLAAEWDYERNGEIRPEQFLPKSGKKVWWRCSICGHEWETEIRNRTNGHGCPHYRRHVQSGQLTIETTYYD